VEGDLLRKAPPSISWTGRQEGASKLIQATLLMVLLSMATRLPATTIPSTAGWFDIPNTHVRSVCPPNLTAGSPASNQQFGKIWLLAYQTNKDATHVTPIAYTWYDEVIISRNQIADPGASPGKKRRGEITSQ
jgi:hypothetical protein